MDDFDEFYKQETRKSVNKIKKNLKKIAFVILAIVALIVVIKSEIEKDIKEVDSSSKFTEREAYSFVVNYGKEGWTIGNQIDGMVGTLSAQGDKCEVIEGQSKDLGNDIFTVSLVVVVNDNQRYLYSWDVNMRNKAVRPMSDYAKKLHY